MPSFEFTLLTILGCTLATWLSRVLPFVLLKKFDLPQPLLEYKKTRAYGKLLSCALVFIKVK